MLINFYSFVSLIFFRHYASRTSFFKRHCPVFKGTSFDFQDLAEHRDRKVHFRFDTFNLGLSTANRDLLTARAVLTSCNISKKLQGKDFLRSLTL